MGLTLREIEIFCRIFEIILGSKDKFASWIYQDCYSFFICLFLKEKKFFQKILNNFVTVRDFLNFVKNEKKIDFYTEYDEKSSNMPNDNIFRRNNNFLLGTIVYTFVTEQSRETDINSIEKMFPTMVGADIQHELFSHLKGGLRLEDGQPAKKICEKINQYQSIFKGTQ